MFYNINTITLHRVFMVLDLRLIKVGCRETTISYFNELKVEWMVEVC